MKRQDDMHNVMLGVLQASPMPVSNTHSLRPHPPACKRLRTKKPQSAKRNMKNKIEMRVESSNVPICTSHKLYHNRRPQLEPYKVEELVEAAVLAAGDNGACLGHR